jgi:Flp pilus assembly protein TadD
MDIEEKMAKGHEKYNDGELSEAENIFKEIVHLQPDNTEVLYLLAEVSYLSGNYDSAAQYIKNALQYDPTNAGAYCNLGYILYDRGRLDDAVKYYRTAVKLNPELFEAHINLGNALRETGQFDDAISSYQKALELDPDAPVAHMNLGVALQKAGRPGEAVVYCRKAAELDPGDANVYYNLGIALQDEGQLDEAVRCYEKASNLSSEDPEILNNLAFALQENRRPYEAIPYYRKALRLNPDYITAHWNLSLALLLTGSFEEGWKEYEWRWGTEYLISSRRDFKQPLWDGSDISGRTILLHAEQGFGDTIQFIRYAPLVADRGANVILECPEVLAQLLRSVKGIEHVVVRGEKLPEFHVQCPLLSLPLAFGTTLEAIPAEVPYIGSDEALIGNWRDRIKNDGSRIKIGVAWAGNPGFRQNRYRNMPLERFLSLTRLPDVTLYSLQKGAEADEAKNLPEGFRVLDHTEEIRDFADTAALIANLDMVISVDTAVAHLAGALGRTVWTLLPFSPEWRWLLDREDSPWYPTMRLFRQSSPGDWQSVMDRVLFELHGRLAG